MPPKAIDHIGVSISVPDEIIAALREGVMP